MNKDSKGLTAEDRFNLFLSQAAVDRELSKIKRPVVNVEPLPSAAQAALEALKRVTPKTKGINGRPRKSDEKNGRNSLPGVEMEDYLDNDKVSDIMKCMICFNMPVYPKECSECSQIVCDTCCIKHDKTKRRD